MVFLQRPQRPRRPEVAEFPERLSQRPRLTKPASPQRKTGCGRGLGLSGDRLSRSGLSWLLPALLLPVLAGPFPFDASGVEIPPLPVDILDSAGKPVGRAQILPNFIVLLDRTGQKKGVIGIVMVEGRMRLFAVRTDQQRKLVGYAENYRLFNPQGELIGFYQWTAIWSYVYDKNMKKVGQAQCLAYQGVCAAGIAAYLLGLF